MSRLLLSVMGAFAEFERSSIRERQREGIALAKKPGVYKGRNEYQLINSVLTASMVPARSAFPALVR